MLPERAAAKEEGQGPGLGLFISPALVTRRGSRVHFNAGDGSGTCFAIPPVVEPECLGLAQ